MSNTDSGQGEKEMFGFRVEQPLAEEIRTFAEDNNMSKSDALKQLVREGLAADELREELDEVRSELRTMNSRLNDVEEKNGFFSRLFN